MSSVLSRQNIPLSDNPACFAGPQSPAWRAGDAVSTILIVDDSPTDTYVATKCAEQLFETVLTTHDANGMFKLLREHSPDIVTMDVNLFDWMNGISLIAEIRASEDAIKDIPIVVISSRSTPADKLIALDAGASGYIVKPVTLEALSQISNQLVPGICARIVVDELHLRMHSAGV